ADPRCDTNSHADPDASAYSKPNTRPNADSDAHAKPDAEPNAKSHAQRRRELQGGLHGDESVVHRLWSELHDHQYGHDGNQWLEPAIQLRQWPDDHAVVGR